MIYRVTYDHVDRSYYVYKINPNGYTIIAPHNGRKFSRPDQAAAYAKQLNTQYNKRLSALRKARRAKNKPKQKK